MPNNNVRLCPVKSAPCSCVEDGRRVDARRGGDHEQEDVKVFEAGSACGEDGAPACSRDGESGNSGVSVRPPGT